MPTTRPPFRVSRFIDFNNGVVFLDPVKFVDDRPAGPWTLDQKIDFFQCRVEVWQLSPAVEMLKQIESNEPPAAWSHAAYGLLFMLTTYFEMVGKILNPKSNRWRSGDTDFNFGFCDVYPTLPIAAREAGKELDRTDDALPLVAELRDLMRNGMFHLGFTKKNFLIHNEAAFSYDFDAQPVGSTPTDPNPIVAYLMKPHQVTRTIVEHFGRFTDELRRPANSARQEKFEEFVDVFHEPNPKKQ